MRLIIIFICIVVSALNAGSSVLERLSTHKPKAKALFSRDFTVSVSESRLFQAGLLLQLGGALLELIALDKASLILIEPILTLDLVFLLIFIQMKSHIRAGWKEWAAVVAIIAGLTMLFVVGRPGSGKLNYSIPIWVIMGALLVVLCIATVRIIRHAKSSTARALVAAIPTALATALNAAFAKLMLGQVKMYGIGQVFVHWPLYALIACGISSIYLMQNTYGAGPLAVSQPVMEIGSPTIGVLIGIMVFHNSFAHSSSALAVEAISIMAMVWGLLMLSRSKRLHQAGARGL